MMHLSQRYTVLPLGDAIRSLRARDLPERAVTITFDDGYADNYEHAWPILKRYGLTATFFLVTRALDRELVLWWDAVAGVVERLANGESAARAAVSGRLPWPMKHILSDLDRGTPASTVSLRLVQALNETPRDVRALVLARLGIAAPDPDDPASDIMMTWPQVREMNAAGVEFGAHTEAHEFLDQTDPQTARREIVGSVRTMTQRLGIPVKLFAYPRGRFAPFILPALDEAGIEAAVTTEGGSNGPEQDPFRLKRIDAGYTSTHGRFSRNLFDAEIQGIFEPIRRLGARLTLQRIND